MKHRLPENVFDLYQALGPGRSYQMLAKQLGFSKRAIVKAANREHWQERLDQIQEKARQRADEKAVDSIEEMTKRQLKVLRYIQGRAIETLKALPLDSAMDAVRAFVLALDKERLLMGEPTDRTATTIEEVTKREMAAFLLRPGEEEPELETQEGSASDDAGIEKGDADVADRKDE